MAAPVGNRFWEARSSHGRSPVFKSPDDLAAAALEYFEWVEANPLYEAKAFHNSGEVVTANLPKMRAMSIVGLCNFLDIGQSTWFDYRKRKDFSDICARIEQAIRQQKFEGASADLLNASIIARDLGLADKSEHTGPNGGPIETKTESKTDKEVARLLAFLLTKGAQDDG